jgi:putative ABC transport system permease protein
MTQVEDLAAERRAVSPRLFEALRVPVRQGRSFGGADIVNAPRVAIVNEALARRLSPDGNVIGRTVRAGRAPRQMSYEIVGVVADVRSMGTKIDVRNEFYVPFAQATYDYGFVVLRTSLPSAQVAELMRTEMRAIAPEEPVMRWLQPQTMESLLRASVAGPRFSAALVTTLSATALVLAAMGVFGLVAYSVSRRMKELGIRAALGAQPKDLALTTMRSALALTMSGVVIGLGFAAYAARFVEKQLYAVSPLDLTTFVGAAVVMAIVAAVAATIPARLAARADPATALRVG